MGFKVTQQTVEKEEDKEERTRGNNKKRPAAAAAANDGFACDWSPKAETTRSSVAFWKVNAPTFPPHCRPAGLQPAWRHQQYAIEQQRNE